MSCLTRPIIVISLLVAGIAFFSGSKKRNDYLIEASSLTTARAELEVKKENWKSFINSTDQKLRDTELEISETNAQTVATNVRINRELNNLTRYDLNQSDFQNLLGISSEEDLRQAISRKFHRHLPTDYRPRNGNVVRDQISDSRSKASLTLINGLSEDAYVKLVHRGKCVASFYVRGDNSFTFNRIPDGTYEVMYCLGFGWDNKAQDFKRGRTANRYDDDFVYRTSVRDLGNQRSINYSKISLTLHKVLSGNATTTEMSPADFDKY